MAYRRKGRMRRRYRRKRYRRNAPRYALTANKLGSRLGFPGTLKFKHSISLFPTVSCNLGAKTIFYISANDIFDPEGTAGSSRTRFFNTLAELYSRWTVIGSKARIKITSDPANASTMRVVTYLNDTPTSASSGMGGGSIAGSREYLCQPGQNGRTFTLTYSPNNYFGPGVMQRSNLQGTAGTGGIGTSPTDTMWYIIDCRPADVTSSDTLYISVEIEYIVVHTERISIP